MVTLKRLGTARPRAPNGLYTGGGWTLLTALAVVDVLALFLPPIGALGVVLWFLSYVYVFSFGAYCAYGLIKRTSRGRIVVTPLAIVLFAVVLTMRLIDPRTLSGETSIELNCTLQALASTVDHGFRETCLDGYTDRQFFLPVLPTLLCGRTLWAHNLGGCLYFILGIVVFSTGILRYVRHALVGDLVNAILLFSIWHIYYFNHSMFLYEQSIFPFCFGLLAVGLFFHYLVEPRSYLLVLMGFSLLYLVYTYTPGLAMVSLGIVAASYLALTRWSAPGARRSVAGIVAIALFALLFAGVSLTFRGDVRVLDAQGETTTQLIGDLGTGFEHILFQNHGNPIVSPVYNAVFLFVTVSSLLFVFGARAALIGWWIVATLIFAVISKGYAYYGIDYRLERATIVFPVFLGLLATVLARWRLQDKSTYLGAAALFIGVTGLYFHSLYMQSVSPNPHWAFIQWLQQRVPVQRYTAARPRTLSFVLGADQYNNMISLNDNGQYFLPHIQIGPAVLDVQSAERVTGILVVPTTGLGAAVVKTFSQEPQRYHYVGSFHTNEGPFLAVFQRM